MAQPAPDKPRHTLVYIRHGQTDWNREFRLQGGRDIPLNETGRAQARANGAALARFLEDNGHGEADFDFVSSPLVRARETMELMRTAAGLDPLAYRLEPALVEVSFGKWEGFTMEELAEHDREGHDARLFDKWGFVPPGGESYAMLSERICAWLCAIARPTVCVAHGAVHRVVRQRLEELDIAEAPVLDVPQDRLYLWRDGRAGWL